MKFLIVLIAILTSAAAPQRTEGERAVFAEGRISFVVPPGFAPMTEEEIARKFPAGNGPRHIYANEAQAVSMGITFSPANLSPEQLDEFKSFMEQMLPKVSLGLVWQAKEVVEMKGRRWVYLKFISQAIDTEIMNEMYITPFDGKAIIIACNATSKEYERAKPLFEASVKTIEVKDR